MTDGARVPPGGSGQATPTQAGSVQSDDSRAGSAVAEPASSDALPEDTLVGLPAAAELAGVHYMTVYRWVRTSRLAAEKSGGIWKVRLGDLKALTDGGSRSTPKADSAGGHRPARFDGSRLAPMTAALLRGDQGGAWLLVDESRRAGVDPVDVLCELIEPAMAEIGRRWRNGEVSVAQEHRATVVAARLIGRLGPAATRPGRSRGGIIVGAVEGNRHSLGSAVVADIFRAAGYDVTDLGADVPGSELVDVARGADNLAAICLSVAVDGEEDVTRRTVAGLRSATKAPVLVGGTGVPDAAWVTAVGADGWCTDGRSAPGLVDRLSEARPGAVGATSQR